MVGSDSIFMLITINMFGFILLFDFLLLEISGHYIFLCLLYKESVDFWGISFHLYIA